MKIKDLKAFLGIIPNKHIDNLSSDKIKWNKKTLFYTLEVATFLLGKDEFTEEELSPFLSQAGIWFILEKLRREGLVSIDNKGVPHKTKLGKDIDEYMKKHNKIHKVKK